MDQSNKVKQTNVINNFNQIEDVLINNSSSFIYMNIRSLRKNFNIFLANINKIIANIKIIILVETNIVDDENQFYTITNFNSVFLNRNGKGGGIAVYVKENINFTTTHINTTYFETIQIDLSIDNNIITLFPIYRPPRHNTNMFINELEQIINTIHKNRVMIVVGDMNVDVANEAVKTTRAYIDMMSSNGLQCIVKEITREDVNKNKGTCIDHMFVRNNKIITDVHAAVVMTTISDHYSLFGCVEQNKTNVNSKALSQGSENVQFQLNTKKVNKLIKEAKWNDLSNTNYCCDDNFNNIYNKFNEIYNKSKQPARETKKRNDYPWLNEIIISYCDVRDRLYQRFRKGRNNTSKEREYKLFNNKLNEIITHAKNEYRRKEFIKNRYNIRGTWILINEIIGKKVNNVDDVIKKNFKNECLKTVTDNFAIKFKENVTNLIHDCNIKTLTTQEKRIQNSIFIEQTNELEIFNILKCLNLNKGAGVDGIRPKDIRYNAKELATAITSLINSSLDECILPKLLKTAIVRPIYKSGVKNDYNNYRPISILPVMEKVLEEIMARRLNNFLVKYNIINKNQYGFQKGKNINKLLGHFSTHINQCLDHNVQCLALFIDFSKAFDTLSHKNLIQMMERCGIRGKCINWFKNYLECRSYRVKIDGNLSQEVIQNNGVPQGSKLGPILYLIYANEMISILNNSTAFAYADDTAIIVANEDLAVASQIMQAELNLITRWCHDNGLIINASKTKIMHIRLPHIKNSLISLKFHDNNCLHKNARTSNDNDYCQTHIEQVTNYKYLGVIVDNKFTWKDHIISLNKKLRKASYVLYHLSNCAPLSVTIQAYFSLAESYLRHGIPAFGNVSHCKILQQTQNRLIKILMRTRSNTTQREIQNNSTQSQNNTIHVNNAHTNNNNFINIHRINNLPYANNPQNNISVNYTRQTIKNFSKQNNILNIKNIYKSTIINEFLDEHYLEPVNHRYNTRRRAEGKFKVPRHNNKHGKNTLKIQMPTVLNTVPLNIVHIRNKYKRKKLIKKHFINSQ